MMTVHLEGDRYQWFYKALCQAIDVNESLASSIPHFPNAVAEQGDIDPRIAVEAYSSALRERLNLLLSMVDNCEEAGVLHLQEVRA